MWNRKTTIKVEYDTWNALRNLKQKDETFDDVIRGLLGKRTTFVVINNVKVIKYDRKVGLVEISKKEELVIEYSYNDIKNVRLDFVIDLKINIVCRGKKVWNPSIYFGVESANKHQSKLYIEMYLKCVLNVLKEEFGVKVKSFNYVDTMQWKKMFDDYKLSTESFKVDVETLLEDEFKEDD